MIRQQTTRLDRRTMDQQSEQRSFDLAGLDLNTTLSGELGRGRNGSANKLDAQDRAFHDWYRFVLSYPPHLVRTYLDDFGLDDRHTVLDPFCGTGTTLVECKLNRLYPKVTKLYFGGMARHLADLRTVLRPGSQLAYVVGDQASYLRVMIRTGQLLAEIAQALGYEVVRIDLFRTRLATATREQLREEVVVLRWPGGRD